MRRIKQGAKVRIFIKLHPKGIKKQHKTYIGDAEMAKIDKFYNIDFLYFTTETIKKQRKKLRKKKRKT